MNLGGNMLHFFRHTSVIGILFLITTILSAQGFEPAPAQKWMEFFCLGNEVCMVGDVNGDGMDDVISFVHEEGVGVVWVGLSNGNGFIPPQSIANEIFCLGGEICGVGYFNGDGKDDIVAFCLPDELCLVGDVDGDGMDDIMAMGTTDDNVKTWIALSLETGFGPAQLWAETMCLTPSICELADVNGDGMDDIVEFIQSDVPVEDENGITFDPGDVRVALSTGTGFSPKEIWIEGFCVFTEAVCTTGDADGDGDADILMFLRDSEPNLIGFDQRQGRVDVAFSDKAKFSDYASQYAIMCIGEEVCAVGDFNGDGKDDIGAFVQSTKDEPEMGDVWVATSVIDPTNPSLTIASATQNIQATQSTPAPTQPSLVVAPSLQALETANPTATQDATLPAPLASPVASPVASTLDLVAGDTVVVMGTVNNRNMRTALPENIVMVILEGYVEVEGMRWWRVAHYGESTTEGWIPEGDGTVNWLLEVNF